MISSFEIHNKVLGFIFIFFISMFLFFFLSNQTWVMRRNPPPCLAKLELSRDANMKVKNSKKSSKNKVKLWFSFYVFKN